MSNILLTAFLLGIISALSLPLGALTSLLWRPEDRAIAFLMAPGGGALHAAVAKASTDGRVLILPRSVFETVVSESS